MQAAYLMSEFRIADRELFNRYFRLENPWQNQEAAWLLVERFGDLESVLFQKMVAEALNVGGVTYGQPQPDILVSGQAGSEVTALINREICSGYWDYPDTVIPADAEMQFMDFFDWDVLSVRDNKYARVRIAACPSNTALTGKHALLEAPQVSYYLSGN